MESPTRHTPGSARRPSSFDAYMNYLAKNGYTVDCHARSGQVCRRGRRALKPRRRSSTTAGSRSSGEHRATTFAGRSRTKSSAFGWRICCWITASRTSEVSAATGLSSTKSLTAVKRFSLPKRGESPTADSSSVLKLRPYPGGRHPRIGFLDGAIRPQRETKFSVFLPWDSTQYVVADIPEAIWMQRRRWRELLYLAHTHVPTVWSRSGIALEPLEWTRGNDGSLRIERRLPNDVIFGAEVVPTARCRSHGTLAHQRHAGNTAWLGGAKLRDAEGCRPSSIRSRATISCSAIHSWRAAMRPAIAGSSRRGKIA